MQITPGNQTIELHSTQKFQYSWSKLTPDQQSRLKSFLTSEEASRFKKSWSEFGSKNIRVTEQIITAGSQITALGKLKTSLKPKVVTLSWPLGVSEKLSKTAGSYDLDSALHIKTLRIFGQLQAASSDKIIVAEGGSEQIAKVFDSSFSAYLRMTVIILLLCYFDLGWLF